MTEPSDVYAEHLRLIRDFHASHKAFHGRRTFQCLASLRAIGEATAAKSMLDYGCGKGEQWVTDVPIADAGVPGVSLRDYLGLSDVTLYDPGVPAFETKPDPAVAFDVVTVVDVLEYIPLVDLARIVSEVFSYARHAVYVNLTCTRPKKPCQLDAEWGRLPFFWLGHILQAAERHPAVSWFARIETGVSEEPRELVGGVGPVIRMTGAGQFSPDDVRRVLSRANP